MFQQCLRQAHSWINTWFSRACGGFMAQPDFTTGLLTQACSRRHTLLRAFSFGFLNPQLLTCSGYAAVSGQLPGLTTICPGQARPLRGPLALAGLALLRRCPRRGMGVCVRVTDPSLPVPASSMPPSGRSFNEPWSGAAFPAPSAAAVTGGVANRGG